jgi:aspartate/glutamate racemase
VRLIDFADTEQSRRPGAWDAAPAGPAAAARVLVVGGAQVRTRRRHAIHKVVQAITDVVDVPFVQMADATVAALRSHGSKSVGVPAAARAVVRSRLGRSRNHLPELERAAYGR